MQYQAEMLATSKAGHDKGKQYVILGEEQEFYLLVNGTTKLLEKPKKKNKKHVQLIIEIPGEAAALMCRIRDDADIRKILRIYQIREMPGCAGDEYADINLEETQKCSE